MNSHDQPRLWPCATLIGRGVAVGGSTDAPFGPAVPWQAVAAATTRRTASGEILGAQERLEPERALSMFLTPLDQPGGPARRIQAGQPADLCLLGLPLTDALGNPESSDVVATIHRGGLRAR